MIPMSGRVSAPCPRHRTGCGSIGERSGGVPGNQVRKVIARGPVAVGAMRLELFRDFPIRVSQWHATTTSGSPRARRAIVIIFPLTPKQAQAPH